ncbi:hypothetical protein quinque_003133 [Culex quinquefasciatus]
MADSTAMCSQMRSSVPPYRGAGCKDGGPERPPIEADQQTGTSAADTSAAGTSAADACVANTSFAATGAAETNTLQDRSVSNITILSDNTMDQGDGEGTESYPDISSDEASSPFTLVDRSKQKKRSLPSRTKTRASWTARSMRSVIGHEDRPERLIRREDPDLAASEGRAGHVSRRR